MKFDIVVIGGGICGATFAAAIGVAGANVLVIEASTYFRDRVRGEWLVSWEADPMRKPDFTSGPDIPFDETTLIRFFAEDL